MTNSRIAEVFHNIAGLLEMRGESGFTVRAYQRTARTIDRQPIDADFEAVFKAAADIGTALEINASPERLDLKDLHVQRARELGVPLVVSTDAHTTEGLDNVQYGVAVARRGWCEPRHILNTWPVDEFLALLKLDKSQRTKAFANHD